VRVHRSVFVSSLLLVAVLTIAGCASAAPEATTTHPASLAVAKLLEMRKTRVKDARSYALFFKSDAIPKSLAEASSKETTATKAGKPPIPEWSAPYVSKLGKGSADVVVLWTPDGGTFPNHSAATVFHMEQYQNRWVIIDAVEVKDAGSAPKPLVK
jgi:hypothetical protein